MAFDRIIGQGERIKPTPIVRGDGEGGWLVHVGAATTLQELSDALADGRCDYPDGQPDAPLYYPVDPTEASAHLGGNIATNASGARTLHYGPTRDWVRWLKVVMADGRILELRRGQVRAQDGVLLYRREDGSRVELSIPDLPIPNTKHTAGYHLKPDMDAVDLFVGSEGTLGIVVEAELALTPKPAHRLFLTLFLDGRDTAIGLTHALKAHPGLSPLALEYIGPRTVDLLRRGGNQTPASAEVARLPDGAAALLYTELPFQDEAELDAIHEALTEVLAGFGLDPAQSWAGFTERDLEEMKRLRHAVPETVNAIIARRKAEAQEIHKVGTDMAVPDESLREMMDYYERRVAEHGLEFVIFGHIGNGHLHVNILPRTAEELRLAQELYMEFAHEAVRLRGSIAGEHGIGRIKKKFLPIQFSEADLSAMRAIKDALDPHGLLDPGVIFD